MNPMQLSWSSKAEVRPARMGLSVFAVQFRLRIVMLARIRRHEMKGLLTDFEGGSSEINFGAFAPSDRE